MILVDDHGGTSSTMYNALLLEIMNARFHPMLCRTHVRPVFRNKGEMMIFYHDSNNSNNSSAGATKAAFNQGISYYALPNSGISRQLVGARGGGGGERWWLRGARRVQYLLLRSRQVAERSKKKNVVMIERTTRT